MKAATGSPPTNCVCQRTPAEYVTCDDAGCSIGDDNGICHGGYRVINVNNYYVRACACPGYRSSSTTNYYTSCSAFGTAVSTANSSITTGANCCTYCCGSSAGSIIGPGAALLLVLLLLVL